MFAFIALAACASVAAAATTRSSTDAFPFEYDGKCVVEVSNKNKGSTLAMGDCDSDKVLKFVADEGLLKTGSDCLGKVKNGNKTVPGLVNCDDSYWTEIKRTWLYDDDCKYIRVIKGNELEFTSKSDQATKFDFEGDVPGAMSADETPKFCGCKKCPADSTCNGSTCVRPCECSSDSDCGVGQMCKDKWCQYKTCKSDKQCPSGSVCDTTTNRCVAKELTCDWPYVLEGNYCVNPKPECSCNKPCPSGYVCRDGKCVPSGGTSTDIPSPSGHKPRPKLD